MVKIEAKEVDGRVDVNSSTGQASIGTIIDELSYGVFNVFIQIDEEADIDYLILYNKFDEKLRDIISSNMAEKFMDRLIEEL